MAAVDITVGGRWLGLEHRYGDVEMSTVWPGGSEELAWTPAAQEFHRFAGGEIVRGYVGPVCVWCGRLTEPDPSQDQLVAQGLWNDGANVPALDGSGNATAVPNAAIDAAISAGLLAWTRPNSLSGSAAAVDLTQGPVTINDLLDAWAVEAGKRWGVDPLGRVYARADDTSATWSTLPQRDGLGFTLDGYASTLVGRYQTSTGYATATRTNTAAQDAHGPVTRAVDLTSRGVISLTKANGILDNMLALTYAVPKWTTDLELAYGEALTLGGTVIALEAVAAGTLLRIPTNFDLAWRLQGQMFLDVPIGRTDLSGGLLTIQPLNVAPRTFVDVMTAALTK